MLDRPANRSRFCHTCKAISCTKSSRSRASAYARAIPAQRAWLDMRDHAAFARNDIALNRRTGQSFRVLDHLGVAALRRFLAAYPSHPLAVRASYEVGASYLAQNKSQEALEAMRTFLAEDGFKIESDEARRDFSQLSMTATFLACSITA